MKAKSGAGWGGGVGSAWGHLMKHTSYCTAMETINKMKTTCRMRRNIYDATDKGLIFKIYKQLIKFNN